MAKNIKYSPYKDIKNKSYAHYANYPAIEVPHVDSIPSDYSELMGVPITFLDKYNPSQFKIVGNSRRLAKPMKDIAPKGTYQQGGPRFYIKRPTIKDKNKGFIYHRCYDRLVIQALHPEKEGNN